MIATGIFLFLLGTKIAQSSAIQSDVKYEPSRITVREQIDQGPVLIPELGPPPYLPNFVHQGSNYYFGMPLSMPQGYFPQAPAVEKKVTEVIEETGCKREICSSKVTDILVEKEKLPFTNPIIEINAPGIYEAPNLALPSRNIAMDVDSIPYMPSVSIPTILNSQFSQFHLPPFNIPGISISKPNNREIPMLIEEPLRTPGDAVVSEVDFLVQKIPPPPELPPLVLEDVLKPVIIVDKKVILIPSIPEIQPMFPPKKIMKSKNCSPTLCAQNIVFERVLPNLACEKSKNVELISIPASNRVPVVATSMFPFVKK